MENFGFLNFEHLKTATPSELELLMNNVDSLETTLCTARLLSRLVAFKTDKFAILALLFLERICSNYEVFIPLVDSCRLPLPFITETTK